MSRMVPTPNVGLLWWFVSLHFIIRIEFKKGQWKEVIPGPLLHGTAPSTKVNW